MHPMCPACRLLLSLSLNHFLISTVTLCFDVLSTYKYIADVPALKGFPFSECFQYKFNQPELTEIYLITTYNKFHVFLLHLKEISVI